MITQTELVKILSLPDQDLKKHFSGWGVIHCLRWLGDMQRAMSEYSKKHPYEKNTLRENYLVLQNKIEKWAYEGFVRARKKEIYVQDASMIGRPKALKRQIKQDWAQLYAEHSY